jgi:hypothetical protein
VIVDRSIITIDVDWAPDFAIDAVARLLRDAGVAATWFVTHDCDAVRRLRTDPLAELGVHPNFLPGSSHGSDPAEVLRHVLSIVPSATSLRSHSTYVSGRVLDLILRETAIEIESNCLLPRMQGIYPIPFTYAGRRLLRVPYFWADDYELAQREPDWAVAPCEGISGLRVYGFHPLSIVLNASSLEVFTRLRSLSKQWSQLSADEIAPLIGGGAGVGGFFAALVERLAGRRPATLQQLLHEHS